MGNVILKVDEKSVVPDGQKRDSVRISSQDSFGFGTLWMLDALHTPYGCRYVILGHNNSTLTIDARSVSGARTGVLGQVFRGQPVIIIDTPVRSMLRAASGGEIDIFEGVNMQSNNQMALHTGQCTMPVGLPQTGMVTSRDCTSYGGHNSGCGVMDANTKSYGKPFADSGGGVWVTQFESSGIKIWFVPVSDGTVKPPFVG